MEICKNNSTQTSGIIRPFKIIAPVMALLSITITALQAQTTYPTRELLRFKLESKSNSDQTVLYLQENATLGFDSKFDAYKLINPKVNLYTMPMENLKLSIDAVSNKITEEKIPLCFSSKEPGHHNLRITEYTNPGLFADSYLIDAYLNTTTPIYYGEIFDVEVSKSDSGRLFSDRYFIDLKSPVSSQVITASNDQVLEDDEVEIFPNPISGTEHLKLHLKHHNSETITVGVMNSSGRQVESFDLPFANDIDLGDIEDLVAGVYFVQIDEGNDVKVNRKLVKD
jgi:hypothetical protein